MAGLQTLDQQRAAYAWDSVSGLGKDLKDYASLALQLPAMLQTNGLGQTVAFLMVKEGAKRRLYKHLEQWLCRTAPHPVYPPQTGQEANLMQSLARGDSLTLHRATREAAALALWLKRFAKALADGADDQDQEVGTENL